MGKRRSIAGVALVVLAAAAVTRSVGRRTAKLVGTFLVAGLLAPVAPAAAADDLDPPSVPTTPRWTDSTGLLLESVSPGDRVIYAKWTGAADASSGVRDYRVQLSATPEFAEVLADRFTFDADIMADFSDADGVDFDGTYYFRVAARDVAGNVSEFSPPSNSVYVRESWTGAAIAHAPVVTANYGREIPISAVATCETWDRCATRLFYRPTDVPASVVDVPVIDGSWMLLDLERGEPTDLNGRTAFEWTGMIPADAVTSTGVDYYLEAEDSAAVTRFPGTIYAGTTVTAGVQGRGTYHHVHVVTPPVLAHVPPAFGRSDHAIPLTLRAACASGATCTATLYYRSTTDSATSNVEITSDNGELIATPDWPRMQMTAGASTAVGDGTVAVTYTADIPASEVDTRGIDYFFYVTDGHTKAWAPGSTYQGYYAPLHGMRTGHYHVRVAETSHIAHAPVAAVGYREPFTVTGQANCPYTRSCVATLHYRTSVTDVMDPAPEPFATAPMSVGRVESVDGNDVVIVTGEVPADVVDTRGVDYFLEVTDGATTSWWPGASPNDGFVLTDGVRVAYHHVRVLEPPHLVHAPIVVAPAAQDLSVTADLTCATEACTVDILYAAELTDPADTWVTIPMARTSVRVEDSPAGRLEAWQGTIPADLVTTSGFNYLLRASDGYASQVLPGMTSIGAYVHGEGSDVRALGYTAMFPVHVEEAPHVVHVPTVVAEAGKAVALEATANCSTPNCTATLHWRPTGGAWASVEMTATPGEVWTFRGQIGAADVTTQGIDYRISVHDGYTGETTPTWHINVTDLLTL